MTFKSNSKSIVIPNKVIAYVMIAIVIIVCYFISKSPLLLVALGTLAAAWIASLSPKKDFAE